MTDLDLLTAIELSDGYRSGRFSPVEVTRAALDAIAPSTRPCTRSSWWTPTERWPRPGSRSGGGGTGAR
jgi:hypothetical protein